MGSMVTEGCLKRRCFAADVDRQFGFNNLRVVLFFPPKTIVDSATQVILYRAFGWVQDGFGPPGFPGFGIFDGVRSLNGTVEGH